MPTNTRIKIKSHLSREKECIIGGVHPESGTSCYIQSNEMNSDITALFLQEVSRKYPDKKIVFILDNVKYHVTQGNSDYPLPKNIELLFLPAYSPDLNLQERVWNHFKTEYVNNKFFHNIKELSFTINKGLRELLYKSDVLKNICSIA